MTRFRTLLLLLVALLLPIRGVVAATMPCASMGQGQRPAMAHAHPALAEPAGDSRHVHGHGGTEGHGHGEPLGPSQGVADDGAASGSSGDAADAAVSDTCHLCASGCGVAALLMSLPAGLTEPPAAPVRFPALALPRLHFQLDGQDRPPRTV